MSSVSLRNLPPSGFALIAINLLPLAGVLFAGWDAFAVVLLYWIETAVIGAVNILRIITASGDVKAAAERAIEQKGAELPEEERAAALEQISKIPQGMVHGMKFFMIPFFCVHFGIFMLVHLVFIFALLGGDGRLGAGSPFKAVAQIPDLFTPMMWFTVLGLVGSHLFSFFVNYIGKGEYREATPMEQMGRPYGRVVVMHIAILFGAFLVVGLGSNIGVLMLLVGGKIAIDYSLHVRDHRKMQAKVAAREGAAIDLDAASG